MVQIPAWSAAKEMWQTTPVWTAAHIPAMRIPGGTTTPIEKMQKIAELFAVPVTDLLDEFNLFLYNGQGRQIKEMRRRRQMTQVEYARRLGVPFGTLQGWEQDRVQICKQTWRRLKIRG